MKRFSAVQIGEICGVSRSTVSYWIAKRSLPASRLGKKHMVSVSDLILFLSSEGRPIPQKLLDMRNGDDCLPFLSFRNCWEHWANDEHGARCRRCNVFTHQIKPCFIARDNRMQLYPHDCQQCRYFTEYYEPQTAFIHQLGKPAAVYRDLYFWACNRGWAELCDVDLKKIPGTGIEGLLHPNSLKSFLNYFKRTAHGNTRISDKCEALLNCEGNEMNTVCLSIIPLKIPSGTWLMLADQANSP